MSDLRHRILDVALRLYAEAGFRGTTTRRVATEAGVNEITLFRQFGTKEALLKAALSRASREFAPALPQVPQDPSAELFQWAMAIFVHWHEARQLVCRVLGDLNEHPEIAPSVCEEPICQHTNLARYFLALRERGLTTASFDAEAAAGLLMGSIFTHAVWRTHMPDPPPAEQVLREYVSLVLAAVGAPAAPTAISTRTE